MSARARRALVALYPASWRARYGDEVLGFLDEEHGTGRVPARTVVDLARAAVVERAREAFDVPTAAAHGDATAELRLVLWGWCACVVGGIGFAKLSEHAAVGVPTAATGGGCDSCYLAAHSLAAADASHAVVQAAALLGLAIVVALAVPAVIVAATRAAAPVRRGIARAGIVAIAGSAVTAGWLAWMAVWARGLTTAQRNGTDGRYELAAVGLAVVTTATLAAWTHVATRAMSSVAPARAARTVTALARMAAVAMAAVAVAVAAWWVVVARNAPGFLGPAAGFRTTSSQWPLVALTEALIVGGAAVALVGAWWRAPTPRRARVSR